LSQLAIKGIELFNEGNYYDAHEELEEAWNEDQGPGRDLYRGILQVGVAYYQIERGNYRGAVKMLLRVRQWLDPLPDTCRGVNLARLKEDVRAVHEALTTLGPKSIDEVDRNLFRPVQYTI
jgi:predicted metal-dependent hydrolase